MTEVFLLHHLYDLDGTEETKFIGVYSSRDAAKLAVERLGRLPGFCDHPDDFHIEAYRVDEDHWTSGFSTLVTIYIELEDEGVRVWRPVHAERLSADRYRIVTVNDSPDTERWTFATGEIVTCSNRPLAGGEMRLVAAKRLE